MGWIGCVHCEKFQRDFVARTFAPVDPFCTECCRAKNGPKCTQIVWNAPKCEFRVQWVGSGAFIAKNSDATSWHELFHRFCPFGTEFCKQPNSPKCSKIVQIAWKQKFRVQWGGSGAFVAKNSNATSGHELLHQLTRFALSVVGQKMVPNAPK